MDASDSNGSNDEALAEVLRRLERGADGRRSGAGPLVLGEHGDGAQAQGRGVVDVAAGQERVAHDPVVHGGGDDGQAVDPGGVRT